MLEESLVKVRKSDVWKSTHASELEPYQDFDRSKIEIALVRAGARGNIVREIAAKVKPIEGMTTEEINNIVVRELENRDPDTAKYWQIKREYQLRRFKK
jgi:hypothetical protein